MSISTAMREVGRPIAYYPRLARFFGSVNAAILFAQLFYWHDKTDNPLGVFKTAEEWEEETGLSYREQVTARKHLIAMGVLHETNRRLEHKIFYRLDVAAVDSAFDEWSEAHPADVRKRNPSNDENAVREGTKAQLVNKTETTSEITQENTSQTLFAQFWDAYPKKVGKDAAYRAFVKRKADRDLLDTMLAALAIQKRSRDWMKDKGQFVPHPSTWLNGGRWMDEVHANDNRKPGDERDGPRPTVEAM